MKSLVIKPIAFPSNGIHAFFAPLSHAPWSILLESGSADHIDSRFHIIVAEPIATLVTEDTQTTINQASGQIVTHDDAFTVLQTLNQQLIGELPSQPLDIELPFIAGALGYFGYDLGRNIENIGNTASNDLHFPDMAVGLYDWAIVVDTQSQQAWQIQFSDNAEQAWQQRHDWLVVLDCCSNQKLFLGVGPACDWVWLGRSPTISKHHSQHAKKRISKIVCASLKTIKQTLLALCNALEHTCNV